MLVKILFLAMLSIGLFSSNLNAQHHMRSENKNKSKMCCCSNHENHATSSEQLDSSNGTQHKHSEKKFDSSTKSTIVHEGTIDLIKIDQNKDRNVYQCPMDWNVISDKFERCPICEMKLKKVTIEKARENLLKHGFKVKE